MSVPAKKFSYDDATFLTEKQKVALIELVNKKGLNAPGLYEFMRVYFPRYPVTTIDKENFYKVEILKKDLNASSAIITSRQARFLVDTYYNFQDHRIRANNQYRGLELASEPSQCVEWACTESEKLEESIKKQLYVYASSDELGERVLDVYGIGPVLASSLISTIDITKAPTASNIWRFAGLDPTQEWKKGQKRPWNARLKTTCWKIGESFKKFSGREECFYGHIYLARKAMELERNERLEYKEQAEQALIKKNYSKETEAYKAYIQGKLPLSRIYSRSARYATKLFLSHYQEVAYRIHYKQAPPKPFAIAMLHHGHYIPCPW